MRIIFNPAAGSARRRPLARAVSELRNRGLHPELVETNAPGDATRLARAAARDGRGLVIAAGGDGTIAEVAAGLAGTRATLGILPFGTANVLAHELGLPMRPEAAAAVLAEGRCGVLHTGLAEGAAGQRLFVQMLGAGFDAAVVHGLPLSLKRAWGRGAYVIQSLRELRRCAFAPIQGLADDERFEAASAIVTKGRFYGGRYLIAPDASPFEAGFSLVLFAHGNWRHAMLAGLALPLGLVPRLPGVTLRRVSRVTFGNAGVAVQADGDAAGFLPVAVRDGPVLPILLPRALAATTPSCSDMRVREEHAA